MVNMGTLTIQSDDLREIYFIDEVVTSIKGVIDVEIDEDNFEVVIDYDSDILTRDFILDSIDYARTDYVGFYMELNNSGMIHIGYEKYFGIEE